MVIGSPNRILHLFGPTLDIAPVNPRFFIVPSVGLIFKKLPPAAGTAWKPLRLCVVSPRLDTLEILAAYTDCVS